MPVCCFSLSFKIALAAHSVFILCSLTSVAAVCVIIPIEVIAEQLATKADQDNTGSIRAEIQFVYMMKLKYDF